LKTCGAADCACGVPRIRASLHLQAGAAAALLSTARWSRFRVRIIREAAKAGVLLSDPRLSIIPSLYRTSMLETVKDFEGHQQIAWSWLRTPVELGLRRRARECVRVMHEEIQSWHEAYAILAKVATNLNNLAYFTVILWPHQQFLL
jgi:hypothetical protein